MCRAKGCKEGCVASCCDNDALSDVIMPCLAHTKDAEFVDGKLIYAPFYLTNYMYTPVFFYRRRMGGSYIPPPPLSLTNSFCRIDAREKIT